jgi:hypothetical protein
MDAAVLVQVAERKGEIGGDLADEGKIVRSDAVMANGLKKGSVSKVEHEDEAEARKRVVALVAAARRERASRRR